MIASAAQTSSSAAASAATVAPAPANRRSRLRLRDLCDEVLASFRVARERDVISDAEREDARTVLAGLSPKRG
jgi:hypothetical protein